MKVVLSLVLFLVSIIGTAQEIEMADKMRADGKIYVVISVLLAILIGLIVYLITIDRKVNKLEKELKNKS